MKEKLKYDDAYLQECLSRAFENPSCYSVPQGIRRYDYQEGHGWFLRVSRDGAKFTKLFRDPHFGSIEAALKAAIQERHEILSSFPVTLKVKSRATLPSEPEKRISKKKSWYGKNKDKLYEAYIAKWYDKDFKIIKEPFAFGKYGGEREAWEQAVAAAKKNHNYKPRLVQIPDNYRKNIFTSYDREEVEIFSTIDSKRKKSYKTTTTGSNGTEGTLDYDPHAFEGKEKLVLHRQFERDPKLRKLKLQEFLKEHGYLHCELCHFSFTQNYPFLEVDIIEVHHLTPLSKLKKEHATHLSDLMLLCSNCHFAIHQGDEIKNVKEAKEHFEKLRNTSDANQAG